MSWGKQFSMMLLSTKCVLTLELVQGACDHHDEEISFFYKFLYLRVLF